MARRKLTDRYVQSLKPHPTKAQIVYWDKGGGFGVRVGRTGRKSFIGWFRNHDGKARTWTIGVYPAMSLSEAWATYVDGMHRLKEDGTDPAATKRAHREAEAGALTFEELTVLYIEKHAKRKKRSWKVDQARLNKYVVPRWANRKAKDITRRDVIAMNDDLVEGTPVLANRVFSLVRKVYNFGIQRDEVPTNPCFHVEKPATETKRERKLSESEIREYWTELDRREDMLLSTKLASKFMLITGQRPSECTGAPWSEIDGRWWTIPASRYKTKTKQVVYLSNMAMGILKESREQYGKGKWIFPNPEKGSHISLSATWQAIDRMLRSKALDMPRFTGRDLRRTVSTRCEELDIAPWVIDRIRGMKTGGVAGHYRQHTYNKETAAALQKWSDALQAILAGESIAAFMLRTEGQRHGNVVQLPASA